jgi:hypothetical protein
VLIFGVGLSFIVGFGWSGLQRGVAMRRNLPILILIVLTCMAGPVLGQGVSFVNLEGLRLTPTVRVGYQNMASSINIPIFFDQFVTELANRGPLDVGLKDAGVWVGGIDLNAQVGRFSVLVSGEASAPKDIRLEAEQEPFYVGQSRVQWQGSRFEWFSLDGRASYEIRPQIWLGAGFKTQKWSAKLTGPSDPIGLIQQFQSVFGDNYTADLSANAWIPYLGLGFGLPNFKASLLFSPVPWVDAKIPFRYLFVQIPHSPFALGYEDDRYRLTGPGLFFELAVDADVVVRPGLKCSLWLKGDWLRIKGKGSQDYENRFTVAGVQTDQFLDSTSALGNFTSYNVSGGLAVEGTF